MLYTQNVLKRIVFACLCISLFQGCNKVSPAQNLPTYIHIDSFSFNHTPSQNALTNINAVWVYYNNSPIGEFDLPVTFPVIANGTGTITLSPAIAVNGLNEMEQTYPFYTNDTFSFTAQPGYTINHSPVTSYYSATKFQPISDFNTGTGFTQSGGNRGIVLITADSLKYPGAATGGIFLTSPGDSSADSTNIPFLISGSDNFIEFDYKCTIPFTLYLQANLSNLVSGAPTFVADVSPSGNWQKFYLYVSAFAAQAMGSSYDLYISTSLPPGRQNGMVLLANINLLSLPQ